MGSISKLLGMLPGMGQIKDQIANLDERDVDRTAAIIKSMTPAERQDPTIINGSPPRPYRARFRCRRQRGQGAGGAVLRGPQDDVPHGPGRRYAGHAGDPGHGRRPRPAEEAAEEGQGQAALRQPDEAQAAGLEAAQRREAAAQGGAFGLPGQQGGQDFELPDEFKKFMG